MHLLWDNHQHCNQVLWVQNKVLFLDYVSQTPGQQAPPRGLRRYCSVSVLSKDAIMMKTIISLLTHSSSPGSASFPSGCCRLKLWPSDHCQSESLAGKQTAEICRCIICVSHQLLWCYRQRLFTLLFSLLITDARDFVQAGSASMLWLPWRWSRRCFSATVWLGIWPCPTEIWWYKWPGRL